MKLASWVVIVYGFLTLLGGIMGYIQAKSTISLIMGVITGIFLILTGYGMLRKNLLSGYLAIVITLFLDAFFTYRFFLTFTFFPAGFMSILSLCVLAIITHLISKHLKKRPL